MCCSTRSSTAAAAAHGACTASGRPRPRATTSWWRPGRDCRRFPMLRQQMARTDTRPNRCLADFVAPGAGRRSHRRVRRVHHGRRGAGSPVTRSRTTTTARSPSRRWPTGWPRRPPSTCTCEARRDWYEPAAEPTIEELHAERFRGIRPAFGYPACPDHSEKRKLFDLLGRRPDRHGADRVVRDDAGRERQRPAASRTRAPDTSPSAGSVATRSRTMPRARASRWPRPSSGCARTCPTSQRPACLARPDAPAAGTGRPCNRPRRQGRAGP